MDGAVTGAPSPWRRRIGVALGVAAVGLLLVGGMLVIGNPSLRARWLGVPLSLRYRAGQEMRQRICVTWSGRHVVRGLPPGLAARLQEQNGQAVQARLDLVTRLVVRSTGADGTAVVESTPESCTVVLGSWRTALPRSPASVQRVDAWGNVLDDAPASGLSAEQRKKFDAFLTSLVSGCLCRESRKVGQSWSEPVDLTLVEGHVEARIKGLLEHALEGFETSAGTSQAVVGARQQLDVKLGPSGGDGAAPVAAEGKYRGSTRFLLDWTGGVLRRVEGQGDVTLSFHGVLPATLTGRRRPAKVTGQATGKLTYIVETLGTEPARP